MFEFRYRSNSSRTSVLRIHDKCKTTKDYRSDKVRESLTCAVVISVSSLIFEFASPSIKSIKVPVSFKAIKPAGSKIFIMTSIQRICNLAANIGMVVPSLYREPEERNIIQYLTRVELDNLVRRSRTGQYINTIYRLFAISLPNCHISCDIAKFGNKISKKPQILFR